MPADPATLPARPRPAEQSRTRRQPPYHVVLENDDHHSFPFVVAVLRKVFGFPAERAAELTDEAHRTGRAVVWTGSREVAEFKADQVHTLHEIRTPGDRDLGPVGCSIEPAPGA